MRWMNETCPSQCPCVKSLNCLFCLTNQKQEYSKQLTNYFCCVWLETLLRFRNKEVTLSLMQWRHCRQLKTRHERQSSNWRDSTELNERQKRSREKQNKVFVCVAVFQMRASVLAKAAKRILPRKSSIWLGVKQRFVGRPSRDMQTHCTWL